MHRLRVLEFQGLAPSVLCGMFFADCGAQVTVVARHEPSAFSIPIGANLLNRNKSNLVSQEECICLNLKSGNDLSIMRQLIKNTDIIIDPFRPQVLEKVGLGPSDLFTINPRIILLRVSGYGQTGPLALKPGHDLNYIGESGILSQFGQQDKPQFPNNYAADFAGCMFGLTGTLAALLERENTGYGQVVDCSLMHCTRYMSLPLVDFKDSKQIHKMKIGQDEYVGAFQQGHLIKDGTDKKMSKVNRIEDLPRVTQPINLLKEQFIIKDDNALGFQFSSPFTNRKQLDKPPERGQHTQKFLREKGISEDLIRRSLESRPKL